MCARVCQPNQFASITEPEIFFRKPEVLIGQKVGSRLELTVSCTMVETEFESYQNQETQFFKTDRCRFERAQIDDVDPLKVIQIVFYI